MQKGKRERGQILMTFHHCHCPTWRVPVVSFLPRAPGPFFPPLPSSSPSTGRLALQTSTDPACPPSPWAVEEMNLLLQSPHPVESPCSPEALG